MIPRTLTLASATVRVYPDAKNLHHAMAEEFVRAAIDTIRQRARFDVALAGGSTPRNVYRLLATDFANAVPWEHVHLWFGDERHVPPDDPSSNYRMVCESLLVNLAVRAVPHRVEAELDGSVAAERYEAELRRELSVPFGAQPRLDLVLLGMGPDGHTASLFPGTPAVAESVRTVVSNPVPQLNTERITLTFPALNNSREIIFLVAGADKAAMLRHVLLGNQSGPDGTPYPSQLIRPRQGVLTWMLDEAAAAGLDKSG